MSVPAIAGHPNYTRSGTANIPELYSIEYLTKQYHDTIAISISTNKHSGVLKSKGDTVIINTIPTVSVGKYFKGKKREWENCKSDPIVMAVNRALDFNVVIDDIDKAQFEDKNFLAKLASDASKQINITIDTELLSECYVEAGPLNMGATAGAKTGNYNLGTDAAPVGITKSNILDIIHNNLQVVAAEANFDKEKCFLAMPSWMRGLINVSDYKDESMTGKPSTMAGGKFGKIGMFDVYDTNLYTAYSGGGKSVFPVLFGSKEAIAFVTQLNKTEYFERLEATSGSGIAGINLYDFKVINAPLLGVLKCYYAG